jgi:hypothetical protein
VELLLWGFEHVAAHTYAKEGGQVEQPCSRAVHVTPLRSDKMCRPLSDSNKLSVQLIA